MNDAIGPDTIIQKSDHALFTELQNQGVILDMRGGVYYSLNNDVAISIWNRIQQPVAFSVLVDGLLEEYEVDRGLCEKDTKDLLLDLLEDGLVLIEQPEE